MIQTRYYHCPWDSQGHVQGDETAGVHKELLIEVDMDSRDVGEGTCVYTFCAVFTANLSCWVDALNMPLVLKVDRIRLRF